MITRIAGGALVGGATLVGLFLGSATAQAQIDPGHYVGQGLTYGFVPTPEMNINVVGNQYQQDYYGLGPQNLMTSSITPTGDGGVVSPFGTDPVSQWFNRFEFHKTPTGYYGTQYAYGVPFGNYVLTETPRLANQPR